MHGIIGARRHGSMAEQRFCKPWVEGSTPPAGSRKSQAKLVSVLAFFILRRSLKTHDHMMKMCCSGTIHARIRGIDEFSVDKGASEP